MFKIMLQKHFWRIFASPNAGSLINNSRSKFISPNLCRFYAKTNDDIDTELNKPVKYTASPAYEWRASHSRIGSKAEFGPWYEPHIVTISLLVFMVYFFILREENDLDALIEKPLSELNLNPSDKKNN